MRRFSAAFLMLASWSVCAQTFEFNGELRAGETYSRKLSRGLVFCLMPYSREAGWEILVSTECRQDAPDFSGIATPPYRGPNALQLDGFHFLPDTKLFSKVREFRFVLREQDVRRIRETLNQRPQDAARILDLAERLGKGRGEVEILEADAVRGEPLYDTKLLRIRFRAKLTIPERGGR
jgi:hypothetical protein